MKFRFVLPALVVLGVAGCSEPMRSSGYFAAHPDEAKAVAEQCRAGTKRDAECAAAEEVVKIAEDAARTAKRHDDLKRELGDGKRKADKGLHF